MLVYLVNIHVLIFLSWQLVVAGNKVVFKKRSSLINDLICEFILQICKTQSLCFQMAWLSFGAVRKFSYPGCNYVCCIV